ncbi:hypothetical protein GPALN_014943 [Globodera pallida]|nr:hypothetical protein GPALN_014943 [Globodera pallida]
MIRAITTSRGILKSGNAPPKIVGGVDHSSDGFVTKVAFRGLLRKNATRPTCSQALSSACYSFAPVKVSAFALQSLSNNKRGTSASTMVFKDAKGTKSVRPPG